MATRSKVTIQDILDLKKENEDLEKELNILHLERFDYALKVNNLERILGEVETVAKSQSSQLLECLEHLCTILQASKSDIMPQNVSAPPQKNLGSPQQQSTPHKAHIVKPHMVNGHVLYRPTINLTRVSDLGLNSQHAGQSNEEDNFVEEADNDEPNDEDDNNMEQDHSETESSNESEAAPLSMIEEQDEPEVSHQSNRSSRSPSTSHEPSSSRSPPHSTVLSGTFQEVKIYLNQTPETRIETSRTSRGSRNRRHTGNVSLDGNITSRRKRVASN